tara:strand:- start:508 stop:2058 length:1551 start_codon:yes stop_codon:yes gene_type:complete
MYENQYKRWVLWIILLIISFVLINFLLWFTYTSKVFRAYPWPGDLSRMDLNPSMAIIKKEKRNLDKLMVLPNLDVIVPGIYEKHINYPKPRAYAKYSQDTLDIFHRYTLVASEIPILTMGDSISRGRGGGVNNYWQDFLATRTNQTVGFIPELSDNNMLRDAILLHNSGFLKKYKVKYLIIQSGESNTMRRFIQDADFNESISLEELGYLISKRSGATFTDPGHAVTGESIDYGLNESKSLYYRAMITQFLFMHFNYMTEPIDKIFKHKIRPYINQDHISDDSMEYDLRTTILKRHISSIYYNSDDRTRSMDYKAASAFSSLTDRFNVAAAMNNNYKMLTRRVIDKLDYYDPKRSVQRAHLTNKFFSHQDGNILYYASSDFMSNVKFNKWNKVDNWTIKLNQKLNKLSKKLKSEGVTLIFMPSPNKLTAYQDYLVEPLPDSGETNPKTREVVSSKSTFFKNLELVKDKHYKFINPKKIIDKYLQNKTKDVYYFDDTHWNNIILEDLAKVIHTEMDN